MAKETAAPGEAVFEPCSCQVTVLTTEPPRWQVNSNQRLAEFITVVELANVVLRPATILASDTFWGSQAVPAPLLTLHWHHLVLQSLHLVYVVGCYPYLLVNLATTLRVQQVSCRWMSALLIDSWMLSSSLLSLVSSRGRTYLGFISRFILWALKQDFGCSEYWKQR